MAKIFVISIESRFLTACISLVQTSRDRHNKRRVRAHEKNSGDTVRRLSTIIQSFFMPNQETAFAWPFVNGPAKVGTQGLFRPCLKTFVAPFLPARLTAPGSLRMVCSTLVCCCWKSCFPRGNLQIIQLSASRYVSIVVMCTDLPMRRQIMRAMCDNN